MENNPVVIVDVNLRPNDIYTPLRWDRYNLARWIASGALCWIFYDFYKNSRATALSFEGGQSILAIIAVLVAFVLFGLLLFPYLRVLAMFRRSPVMKKTRRYSVSASGITMHTEDATSDVKWSLYKRAFETPSVFLLSQSPYHATYLPKRCFANPDDVARMRGLIRANMPAGSWSLRRE